MKKALFYEAIRLTLGSIIYISIICQTFFTIIYLILAGIFLYFLAIEHLLAMGFIIGASIATFLLPIPFFLFLIIIANLIETIKILIHILKDSALLFFYGVQRTSMNLDENEDKRETANTENKPKNNNQMKP